MQLESHRVYARVVRVDVDHVSVPDGSTESWRYPPPGARYLPDVNLREIRIPQSSYPPVPLCTGASFGRSRGTLNPRDPSVRRRKLLRSRVTAGRCSS